MFVEEEEEGESRELEEDELIKKRMLSESCENKKHIWDFT